MQSPETPLLSGVLENCRDSRPQSVVLVTLARGVRTRAALDAKVGMSSESHDGSTRRRLIQGGAVALAAASVPGVALAQRRESLNTIVSTLATAESFGVTFLTEAIKRAPGTPSPPYGVETLKAANTAEYDHVVVLRRLGGRRDHAALLDPGGGVRRRRPRSVRVGSRFTVAPILFGLDKFAGVLTDDWTKYLATSPTT